MLELPTAARVRNAIVGHDEADTRERQSAAFFILNDYIAWRIGNSPNAKAPVLNERRQEYVASAKNADGVLAASPKYYRGEFDYHWEVLAQFLSVDSLAVLSRLPDYQRIAAETVQNRAFHEAEQRERERALGAAAAREAAARQAAEAARQLVELFVKYGARPGAARAAATSDGTFRASCEANCESFSLRIPCPSIGTVSFTEEAYRACTSERAADRSDCLEQCR